MDPRATAGGLEQPPLVQPQARGDPAAQGQPRALPLGSSRGSAHTGGCSAPRFCSQLMDFLETLAVSRALVGGGWQCEICPVASVVMLGPGPR